MFDLTTFQTLLLLAAVFTVAFFYSSVGRGGATGYLAALAMPGIVPASVKIAVLVTNVLVASIGRYRFSRAGFIVLNSLAGLVGAGWEKITPAGPLLWLTVPAVTGALIDTHLGARRWSSVTFNRVLAGVKLLIEAHVA